MPAPRRAVRTTVALSAAALLVPLAACGNGDETDSASSGGGTLTVLAAASLTDVFKEAGAAYEKDHPGWKVRFSFAGSQELASQVKQGAPADVVVTADTETMDGLGDETAKPSVIAKNRLVIAVRKGNPQDVGELGDLADERLKVVLAAPEVPVGRYSREVLDAQDLQVKPVSQESDVRAVLSKVRLGEADAGVVYRTDATTAPEKVSAIEIPDQENAVADYPAAVLDKPQHEAEAQEFVKWLGGAKAQGLLRQAGFQKP
ncbi:molybdate ABC transporter substrate-binding protein [Streptomyces xiaopingdaonensis]|uniref:molybdate ABC transporter substrate-binding protein n=1 Tax=Streptomyces xiaopingdaonensis TaxID=1565415 RepID=UPI00030CFDF1|nr:molybdate ABC transporter substrate-binding protein [Streptomyces xiaopingdaonensis]